MKKQGEPKSVRPMTTRREFIIGCSTTAAALAFVSLNSTGSAAVRGANFQPLEKLTYSALASQINTVFRVHISASRAIHLKLLKAPLAETANLAPGMSAPADAGNEKFSLVFCGMSDELIESGIHHFEHPRLGQFEMYIGQFGRACGKTVRYEAVFNRPRWTF